MPDPAGSLYLGLPGYVYLRVLTLLSFCLFGWQVAHYVRVLLSARAEVRWDHLGARLKLVAVNVLGQKRLLQEPVIGLAHFLIFWAFVFYAAGFFWNLLRGLFPALPVPYADEVWWMALALAVLGALGLVALAVAAVRRYFFTPPRLEKSRDASIILTLIAVVLVSSLVGQGFKARSPGVSLAMWWAHMVTVLGFMAYLPYSKHLHLLASPFAVFFGALEPGKVPAASWGASKRNDFTWRQLFSGLACAECGRCDRVCPAFNSGHALSPKMLMHHLKELVRGQDPDNFTGGVVKEDEIWACTTCAACIERCPVFNEHIPVLIEMRRYLVAMGQMDKRLQEALTNLARYGNSFGTSPRARAKWTQQLNFKVKDARKEPVQYLWFVGDYASFDPRVVPATVATARLLHRAGVDFGILYEAEHNSGNDVRLVGEVGLCDQLMERNVKAFDKAKYELMFTTDPHTYNVLKHEYPARNGRSRVLHYTELLAQLMRSGKLTVKQSLDCTATYHDPCYLGRYNGIYSAPRQVLANVGVKVKEMPRNRDSAYCCGAGGGCIWMEDAAGIKERPSENRVREAARVRGVQKLVVSCPKDLVMFEDAIKTTGLEKKLEVTDLAQLVDQATA